MNELAGAPQKGLTQWDLLVPGTSAHPSDRPYKHKQRRLLTVIIILCNRPTTHYSTTAPVNAIPSQYNGLGAYVALILPSYHDTKR